jgi:hypothetical protein
MLRKRTTHYLFLLLIASLYLNSSCSYCGRTEQAPVESPGTPSPIVNTLPFSTKEPATYQADIVITFAPGETGVEQKYFTAREGDSRRTDYQLPGAETVSLLEKPEGRMLVLRPQNKCAADDTQAGGFVASQMQSLKDSLTTGWLAENIPSGFSEAGKENIAGKSLTKCRVNFMKRAGVESQSEAMVWVDPELGMPVKTEAYSTKDGKAVNKMTTEFRNLKLSVDPGVFDPPQGCQNISFKELQRILQSERLGAE